MLESKGDCTVLPPVTRRKCHQGHRLYHLLPVSSIYIYTLTGNFRVQEPRNVVTADTQATVWCSLHGSNGNDLKAIKAFLKVQMKNRQPPPDNTHELTWSLSQQQFAFVSFAQTALTMNLFSWSLFLDSHLSLEGPAGFPQKSPHPESASPWKRSGCVTLTEPLS